MDSVLRPISADPAVSFGALLRAWRQRRRRSQLDLALDAEVSQRHLSFVESGRASPSREMILRLAETLDVPLRERNALLLAAGYAPFYAERQLDHLSMQAARSAVDQILRAHLPHPALAVDRHWHMIAANQAITPLLQSVQDPQLLQPPVNVVRLSLHPRGLAPQIVNLPQWRGHLLDRLRRQAAASSDPTLAALLAEVASLDSPSAGAKTGSADAAGSIAVPLELETAEGRLSLISTTMVFGTATEITLSEVAVEAFYPADDATAKRLELLLRACSKA